MVQMFTLLKSSKLIILMFIFFSCLIFFQGITQIPVLDRDEARFASATKNMLQTENYIDISIEGVSRYKKPIGIYWLQSLSTKLFSNSPFNEIWTYRIPSTFGILLSIIIIFIFTKKIFNKSIALLSCFFLSTSFLLISEMHQAKTDGVLFLCINICTLILLHNIHFYSESKLRSSRELYKICFWLFFAFGVMIKGPIILIFIGFPILLFSILSRNIFLFKSIHTYYGYILFLIIVLPWFVLISKISEGRFWHESVINDLLNKVFSGQESHGFFPGYYSILLFLFMWPGCIFVVDATKKFFNKRKQIHKSETKILFLICCFLPCFIFFELITTKLPHYVMPTYTSLSILLAVYIIDYKTKNFNLNFINLILLYFFPFLFISIYFSANILYSELDLEVLLVTISLICALILCYPYTKKCNVKKFVYCTGILQIIFYFVLVYSLNPKLEKFWIAKQLNDIVSRKENIEKKVFHTGFNEPSLIFLIGHKSKRLEPESMVKIAKNSRNNLFIMTEEKHQKFAKSLSNDIFTSQYYNFVGFNYSKGKFLKFIIYEN